ncbi:MAG: hypothetical protein ACRENO_04925 [Thermodesulfobacteriota bacterium]
MTNSNNSKIDIFLKEIGELIIQGASINYEVDENSAYIGMWESRCINIISKYSIQKADEFKKKKSSIRINDPAGNYKNRKDAKVSYLQALYEDINLNPDFYIEDSSETKLKNPSIPDFNIDLMKIFDKFHIVASQIKRRHSSRTSLEINDEYDVQDLLHALLRLFFDDIRAEETTPSYAGKFSRMDFLLKSESVVVEVKKTNAKLKDGEIGTQLLDDITRYKEHPSCKILYCFVYDPESMIINPKGLEHDLSRTEYNLEVKVVIRPKGY